MKTEIHLHFNFFANLFEWNRFSRNQVNFPLKDANKSSREKGYSVINIPKKNLR